MFLRSRDSKTHLRFPLICLVLLCGVLIGSYSLAESGDSISSADHLLYDRVSLTGDSQDIANALANKIPRNPTQRPLKTTSSNKSLRARKLVAQDKINKIKSAIKKPGRESRTLRGLVTAAQRENLKALTAGNRDGKGVQVIFNKNNGTPTFIKIKEFMEGAINRAKSPDEVKNIADQFIKDNCKLLKLRDPGSQLNLKQKWNDSLGASHYCYQQVVEDVPVFNNELMIHVDGSNCVYLFNGRYEPATEPTQIIPNISESQAMEIAKEHLHIQIKDENIIVNHPELIFYALPSGQMVLTYKIDISVSISERWLYFIDALTGAFVHRLNKIHSELVSASGIDLHSTLQPFNAWNQNGEYYLVDASMPSLSVPADPIARVQSPGNTYILNADNTDGYDLFYITSTSPDSGWDRAGVSTMSHIKTVYDYYKETFDRDGIDDNNLNFMAVVHLKNNYANAFWNGKFIVFGDGDGTIFSNFAMSLDLTAHEIQHGVTEFTAGLIYENQSGALNEAYSDLFACMVDSDDWTVGEDCTITWPYYIRNLANPSLGLYSLPTKMSEYRNFSIDDDNGGVHFNMSIPSRAGYLMAEGLTIEGLGTGIGREKTARIWYRALTNYLVPSSRFLDARRLTIQAAEDLYGNNSTEVAAVQAAWDAVEVTEGRGGIPDSQEPTQGEMVIGEDIMVYLYPEDGTHDNPHDPDEHYSLYVQTNIDGEYGQKNIECLSDPNYNFNKPFYTRPALYTDTVGNTFVLYTTEGHELHYVWIDSNGTIWPREEIYIDKDIYSIALSPDGRYFAYTTPGAGDNEIHLLDWVEGRSESFTIMSPNDTEDSSDTFNTILYADSLAFDYTSKMLVFDALNCVSTPGCSCDEGDGHRYWTIGILTLANDPYDKTGIIGRFEFPFPNQNPDYDLGFPAFASNNNYVIALDFIDSSKSAEGIYSSMVYTLNWRDRKMKKVANVNFGTNDHAVFGVPSFWGDDKAITIQCLTDIDGSAYKVPIDDGWAGPADSNFVGSDNNIRYVEKINCPKIRSIQSWWNINEPLL